MKVSGYVNLHLSHSLVPCMACDKEVVTKSIDNLEDIDPDGYTIIVECEQCECGFVNVLEYVANDKYSLQASVDRTNEVLNEQGSPMEVHAHTILQTSIYSHNTETQEESGPHYDEELKLI